MSYRKTKLYLRKSSPLDRKDIIQKFANWEAEKDELHNPSFIAPKPRKSDYRASQLHPSVGLWNMFAYNVESFFMELRP